MGIFRVFPKFYRSPFLERRQTGQQPRAAAEGDRQEAGPSVESGRSDVESPPPQRVTYTGETASTNFDDDGPDRATTGSVQQVSKYVVTREEAEPTRTSGCGLDDSQELVVARDDDECALREFVSELVEVSDNFNYYYYLLFGPLV
ncbi:unnamed protein product [Anisakis simplex]|uniref:Uncharacterized protein n=1 Tax=Anisakis simplex TaxID=6269 RepID=A0A0M3JGH1_ANISI|nr:unnamed protein product [Anisakis simplex]